VRRDHRVQLQRRRSRSATSVQPPSL
jgi:hypothetical protein